MSCYKVCNIKIIIPDDAGNEYSIPGALAYKIDETDVDFYICSNESFFDGYIYEDTFKYDYSYPIVFFYNFNKTQLNKFIKEIKNTPKIDFEKFCNIFDCCGLYNSEVNFTCCPEGEIDNFCFNDCDEYNFSICPLIKKEIKEFNEIKL